MCLVHVLVTMCVKANLSLHSKSSASQASLVVHPQCLLLLRLCRWRRANPHSSAQPAGRSWEWAPEAAFPVLCRRLDEQGFSKALSLWLGSNLVPNGQGKLTWSFNVHGAKDMFESYNSLDYWGLLQDPPAGCTLHVVRAERSDR